MCSHGLTEHAWLHVGAHDLAPNLEALLVVLRYGVVDESSGDVVVAAFVSFDIPVEPLHSPLFGLRPGQGLVPQEPVRVVRVDVPDLGDKPAAALNVGVVVLDCVSDVLRAQALTRQGQGGGLRFDSGHRGNPQHVTAEVFFVAVGEASGEGFRSAVLADFFLPQLGLFGPVGLFLGGVHAGFGDLVAATHDPGPDRIGGFVGVVRMLPDLGEVLDEPEGLAEGAWFQDVVRGEHGFRHDPNERVVGELLESFRRPWEDLLEADTFVAEAVLQAASEPDPHRLLDALLSDHHTTEVAPTGHGVPGCTWEPPA